MSLLYEIAIEPGKSKTYLRFTLVVYLITVALIFYSSVYLFIKAILLGFIVVLLKKDWSKQNPCSSIRKIHFTGNGWVLEPTLGNKKTYVQATILIHNPFFLLIEFKSYSQKKHLVLFLDQITNNQLRLLFLKTHQK
ncbi:Uncharacterised protein [Legionella steigerwaltii]|uniref:Toxin CptA n=1 Tax=Legionella steigerwaltii TaxID=460 RepID=A0A378LB77_9GAMM|nr:hypothetical protein [Legionella steigerwaltii]KTD81139.1 hypothetical protein Lstg_0366 [Legionella steigerwaltii]STY23172.1 Uncharacterised protein [Legionella steigerwaltii]